MITVDYKYYKNVYGGSLGETVFNSLLPKAMQYLNVYTRNKYNDSDMDAMSSNMIAITKNCACACVDCLSENTDNGSLVHGVGVATSESVGPWHVTKNMSDGVAQTASQAFLKTIQFYLAGTSFFVTWC